MRLAHSITFSIVSLWVSTGAVLAQKSPSASGTYVCVDAAGRNITSDRPIAQCAGREQRVLGPSGIERARLAPTLTEQEKAAQQQQARQTQQAQQAARELRRQDAALLSRFPTPASHDAARAVGLANVQDMQKQLQQQMQEMAQEKVKLDQELEFYAKDPSKAPAGLRLAVSDLEMRERDVLRRQLAHAQEIQRMTERFDAERHRLQMFWPLPAGGQPLVATTP